MSKRSGRQMTFADAATDQQRTVPQWEPRTVRGTAIDFHRIVISGVNDEFKSVDCDACSSDDGVFWVTYEDSTRNRHTVHLCGECMPRKEQVLAIMAEGKRIIYDGQGWPPFCHGRSDSQICGETPTWGVTIISMVDGEDHGQEVMITYCERHKRLSFKNAGKHYRILDAARL